MKRRRLGWAPITFTLMTLACGGSVESNATSGGAQSGGSQNGSGKVLPQGGKPTANTPTATKESITMGGSVFVNELTLVPCGNFVLDPGEECDDGLYFYTKGDGCTENCKLEPGWLCPTVGKPCVPGPCGDAILGPYETCDDGNTVSGDGCLGDCSDVEFGWSCPGAGLSCFPICGDGIVTGTESCDDGNQEPFDGCSSHCTISTVDSCSDSPLGCTPLSHCGDGILDDDEECDHGTANRDDSYGGCTKQCRLGPRCGDEMVNGAEACDQGQIDDTTVNGYGQSGCTKGCKVARYCGDSLMDLIFDEECDLGLVNTDAPFVPNGCTTHCRNNGFIGP